MFQLSASLLPVTRDTVGIHRRCPSRRRRQLGRCLKGVGYMAVLISGAEVWRGFSYFGGCESRRTAFDAAEARWVPECCTKCYQDNSFTSVVPASAEYWIAVQVLTDESVSVETPYCTDLTVTKDPAWNSGDSTDAVCTMPEGSVFQSHQPPPRQVGFVSPE